MRLAVAMNRTYDTSVWPSSLTGAESTVTNRRVRQEQLTPQLTFLARVALRVEAVRSIGETPDGVRLDFTVQGNVYGPALKGKFPACAAYLIIDVDGVGTISVRAPLLLDDGALAELEASGRYDFGEDGYRRAVANDLPNSFLGWCPRFLTGHPRYLWLNRTICLGVGELRPRETRVDYDLFGVGPATRAATTAANGAETSSKQSLHARLGGVQGVRRLTEDFIDALDASEALNRQNPKVAAARMRVNPEIRRARVTAFIDRLTGGSSNYAGRPLKAAHANLGISEADWALAGEELVKVLDKHHVAQPEKDELLTLLESTKLDIVTRK